MDCMPSHVTVVFSKPKQEQEQVYYCMYPLDPFKILAILTMLPLPHLRLEQNDGG